MRLPALEARCSVDWPRRSHYSYRHVLTLQRTQLQPVHTTYECPMQIKPDSGFQAQACRPRKRERGLCSALRCGLASREMSASSEVSHLIRVSNCHSVCCRVSTPCVLSEVVLLAPSGAHAAAGPASYHGHVWIGNMGAIKAGSCGRACDPASGN